MNILLTNNKFLGFLLLVALIIGIIFSYTAYADKTTVIISKDTLLKHPDEKVLLVQLPENRSLKVNFGKKISDVRVGNLSYVTSQETCYRITEIAPLASGDLQLVGEEITGSFPTSDSCINHERNEISVLVTNDTLEKKADEKILEVQLPNKKSIEFDFGKKISDIKVGNYSYLPSQQTCYKIMSITLLPSEGLRLTQEKVSGDFTENNDCFNYQNNKPFTIKSEI